MSLGLGLGAFMSGVRDGASTANFVKGAIRDRQTRKMEKAATADATAAREADIAKGITTTTDANGVTSYGVGDQVFADAKAAHDASEARVGKFMDYYRTTAVPKLIEGYTQAGDMDRATRLQSYLDSEDGKARFKDWAGAATRFAMGDNAGGFEGLAALNKRMNNGVDIVDYAPIMEDDYDEQTLPGSKETVRIPNGKQRETGGWRVNWKDAASGRTFSQDFDTADDFARTALWGTSPEYQAQYALSELTASQKARAAAAEKGREYQRDVGMKRLDAVIADQRDDRNFRRDMKRDEARDVRDAATQTDRDARQHGYRMEEDVNSAQVRQAYPDPTKGETAEDVRKAIETITERLAVTDLKFAKLSAAEQTKRATEIYNSQRSSARGVLGTSAPAPTGRGVVPTLY